MEEVQGALKMMNHQKEHNPEGVEYMKRNLTRTKFVICMGLIISHLTGCGSYSNKFDCPYGEGLGCASVSKVNKMLDADMVDLQDRLSTTSSYSSTSSSQTQIPIYFGPMRPSQTITFNGIPVI